MQALVIALLAFIAWTLLLIGAILTWRGASILFEKKAFNAFPADVPHGSDRYRRLIRAHLNALENLPLFAGLVAAAALTEHIKPGTLAGFTWLPLWSQVVVAARVGQSLMHVASASVPAVAVRFLFFFSQLIAWALLCSALLSALL